jgi:DNA-binding cell septation regulator SpoVG
MTSFAVRQVDCGNTFVLIQKLRQISGDSGLIVGMRDHQQNVGLEPDIRLGCR